MRLNKRAILFISFLIGTNIFAQNKKVSIFINSAVDTANVEIASAIRLWENYLNSGPDSIYDNPYWSRKEKLRYKDFDLLRSSFSNEWFCRLTGNSFQHPGDSRGILL